MVVLGLDTTGGHCTAALTKDGVVLAQMSEDIGRGHAERLAPMVQEIMSTARLKPANVDQLAVCTGPGSFTGLRVALAFAKGFALPRELPVIGLSALECLAGQIGGSEKSRIASVINVRRGQVCWAVYDEGEEIAPPTTQDIEAASTAMEDMACNLYVGDGAELLGLESVSPSVIDGASLCRLSVGRSSQAYPAVPLYSRGPDAKLPGGKSL